MAVSFTVFSLKRDKLLIEKRHFSYPLPFNLYDHLELLQILTKILVQTAQVPELLGGATI